MSNVVGLDLESLGWLESSIRDLIVLVVREMHSTSGDEKRSGETSEVKVHLESLNEGIRRDHFSIGVRG